jgi:hypothetical protein
MTQPTPKDSGSILTKVLPSQAASFQSLKSSACARHHSVQSRNIGIEVEFSWRSKKLHPLILHD